MLGDAQGTAQPAHADHVGAAERAGQQLLGQSFVQGLGVEGDLDELDQRPHARLLEQRHLAAAHHDRHARRDQRPAQQRHLPGRRPDQHGHPRPGHPVEQVGAAQGVGDDRRLLGGAVGHHHPDVSGLRVRERRQVTVTGAAGDGGQAGGDAAGGRQEAGAAAAADAQREDRRPLAVGAAEPVGEVHDPVDVGAAEPVDRLIGVADRDQVAALPASRCSRASWAGSVSWYSSTRTTS
nr:hypothetical protein GCM10020093_059580 [Planobispora longispora]